MRSGKCEVCSVSYRQQITGYSTEREVWIEDYRLKTMDRRLQIGDYRMRSVERGAWTVDCRPAWTMEPGLWILDYRLHTDL